MLHPFLIISGCDHNDHTHCPLLKDKIVQNSSIRTWTRVHYRLRECPIFRCFISTRSIVNLVGASSSVRYNGGCPQLRVSVKRELTVLL